MTRATSTSCRSSRLPQNNGASTARTVAIAALTGALAAGSAAFLGRTSDATKYLSLLRQLDPGLRVSNIGERVTLRRAQDRERLAEGLREAGLPE
jgi:hypothetical protein